MSDGLVNALEDDLDRLRAELESERAARADLKYELGGELEAEKRQNAALIAAVEEPLYNAEQFLVTVQTWMGHPDDKHEALDEVRAALESLRAIKSGRSEELPERDVRGHRWCPQCRQRTILDESKPLCPDCIGRESGRSEDDRG